MCYTVYVQWYWPPPNWYDKERGYCMGFQRINLQITDKQYRVLLAEANATGLRVGTICRMLIHDDIAAGRASKHTRQRQREEHGEYHAQGGPEFLNGPECH